MGNFLSISVPRFKYTHSKESTPPASMCRWFRVVMEVVRWRLAWSNCFMSLVISLTCAGTSQTGKANNKEKGWRKQHGMKEEVKAHKRERKKHKKVSAPCDAICQKDRAGLTAHPLL